MEQVFRGARLVFIEPFVSLFGGGSAGFLRGRGKDEDDVLAGRFMSSRPTCVLGL